jgi:hypothetical protein
MAAANRAPRQRCLVKDESVNSFESWRQNLLYILSLDENFAPFLVEGSTWKKRTRGDKLRGFVNDPETVTANKRKTAEQKVNMLELMLGQVANYCPVLSRSSIVKNSTSIGDIWQSIRLHYGFQSTGAYFLDFADFKLGPDERPEDLFQRIAAFMEDNLLRQGGGISHHGEAVPDDEEMSPTLENMMVLTWLRLIHKDLPRLIKQRYGTELRSRTLSSIKPEISQAMDSLLDEIRSSDDARVMRTTPSFYSRGNHTREQPTQQRYSTSQGGSHATRTCVLCKAEGRDYHHYLSKCIYLPDSDKRFMIRARQIADIVDDQSEDNCSDTGDSEIRH